MLLTVPPAVVETLPSRGGKCSLRELCSGSLQLQAFLSYFFCWALARRLKVLFRPLLAALDTLEQDLPPDKKNRQSKEAPEITPTADTEANRDKNTQRTQ